MRIQKYARRLRRSIRSVSKQKWKNYALLSVAFLVFVISLLIVWAANLKIPTLESFSTRQVVESTKIFDRTGEILLYDVNQNVKRTTIPFYKMASTTKNAFIAIEDHSFYQHGGVDFSAYVRAFVADVKTLSLSQGGSTITQQVVKNALLSNEKSFSRKIKEFALATKLEEVMTKDEILEVYLNEIPFGGAVYGVEEASQMFFGKKAIDVSLAESAYLAAVIKAPSFYSPYGPNKDRLNNRKNLVLEEMYKNNFITSEQAENAKKENVTFKPRELKGIKAPHFVFYVISQLEEKYGESTVQSGGLRVITTLDWKIEQAGEEIADQFAKSNKVNFNASNDAFVAIDPKTGGILAMIGSHDYFDTENIDGNFNIATAHRQPGSTFKPFVYAAAFAKGYTTDTVLFDVPTQFSTNCNPANLTSDNGCYAPVNYDGLYRGPMTLRNALAQSINIPAVKTLYLSGIKNSIQTAQSMGIQSLGSAGQYGLTLVLGGGEVSLLDMTSAYGVFATEGVRHPYTSILKVEDNKGMVLEEYKDSPQSVIPADSAQKISDILSDNVARTPAYGANSVLYFPNRSVAVKTGTTNDYKDAWIIGYTPSVVLGAWAGNNDNSPMSKKVAGLIVAPMWRAFMDKILAEYEVEQFNKPPAEDAYDLKPVFRGKWQGGSSHFVDSVSGKNATSFTPTESTVELLSGGIHSILHWVNRDDPRGAIPTNPNDDPQYRYWEYAVSNYLNKQGISQPLNPVLPQGDDDVHTAGSAPSVSITSPVDGSTVSGDSPLTISISYSGQNPPKEAHYYLNGNLLGKTAIQPFSYVFIPNNSQSISAENNLKVIYYDSVLNSSQAEVRFLINGSQ